MDNRSELIKWLDIDELQQLQNSFGEMTEMSALAIDMNGNPLTQKTGGSTFCDLLVGQSGLANDLCSQCRYYGTHESAKLNRGACHYCHMGLIEFTAPIIIDNEPVACLVGGMVFEKAPKENVIRTCASRYDIDSDLLWDSAQKVAVRSIEKIEKAAFFLYKVAGIVSNTANSRMQMDKTTRELEKTAQLKDDFLANMSHEIRTPMNAVIGITDIALHESMPVQTAEYFRQIQSSGKALLHIINDILDYSKISSGKMDIFEEEYNPAVFIKDVTTIISNRANEKDGKITFLVSASPSLPRKLFGDSARIQQILINIANNAVKFTNEGFVKLSISSKQLFDDEILLVMKVEDSGIGIKTEDLDKLFDSFTQVDSKRNRSVEGTGLGLAIVKQLVDLMHGKIYIESKYGQGSTFTVEIPQKIVDSEALIDIQYASMISTIGIISNRLIEQHFQRTADTLGISTRSITSSEINSVILRDWLRENFNKQCFLFVDKDYVKDGGLEKLELDQNDCPNLNIILVLEAFEDENEWKNLPYVKTLRLPLYSFNLATVFDKKQLTAEAMTTALIADFSFKAPTAKVLVVDDVPMNLKVAQRLLAKFEVQSDLANSGKEALDMVVTGDYDIVFMDHMMPEIDGIDTTRLIRRFHPKLNSMPIIALTANVMGDARKMFLDEGMEDLLPKPIDMKSLKETLLKWLPSSKIEIIENEDS